MNRRAFLLKIVHGVGGCLATPAVARRVMAGERRGRDVAALRLLRAGTAAAVLSGDRLRLADGTEARLAVFEAASPPAGAEPGRRWPLAEAATQALGAFVADGAALELWAEQEEPDRHGRLVVHLRRVADGQWAQEALLRAGHGRVRPSPGDVARARDWLALEEEARRAGRGIWATRVYAVRAAADVGRLLGDAGALTLAEGRPTRVETRNGRTYLDFGEDWRRDFTAAATAEAVRGLRGEGVAVKELTGRLLRLRGWPERRFGPQMEIVVAAQLEVLD